MAKIPRSRVFMVLLVATIALATQCAPTADQPRPQEQQQPMVGDVTSTAEEPTPGVLSPCSSAGHSKNRPIICVDAVTLLPTPSQAEAWDREIGKDGNPSRRPVTIRWFSNTTIDLRIKFKDKTCVDQEEADCRAGEGECRIKLKDTFNWVDVKPDESGKQRIRCKYDLFLGDQSVDPEDDLIVNPCCN